ncbi:helix-turn-helix domain-containing protein [Sorangium sp. So ce1000]|uniref:helix-turn-helix domain-containing protein n=1 Tax=Sorangium sp. So ce1000 TaxID=3133325 RepID=UPI003F5F5311
MSVSLRGVAQGAADASERLSDVRRPPQAAQLALAEVASSVGYRDEAAFNVAFRREVGVPPGAYRSAGRDPES